MQNSKTHFIVSGAIISLIIVLLGVINFIGFILIRDQQLQQQIFQERVQKQLDLISQVQVDFKTQIQEWKNILLRGHDDVDFTRYFSQFEARERSAIQGLKTLMVDPYLSADAIEIARQVNGILVENGIAYRKALQNHSISIRDHAFIIDREVRGIDRYPMILLSNLNQKIFTHAELNRHKSAESILSTVSNLIGISGICLVTGIGITMTFILDRRRFERDMSFAKAEADRANQAKSSFLAHMSHEIRTPMNGITAAVDLLKSTELPKELHEAVQVMESSSESLTVIVNDVLDLSKIEAGQLKLDPTIVSLNQFLTVLYRTLQPVASNKDIALDFQWEEEKNLYLLFDPIRLRQVLLNLLSNAVKFTEKGTVSLLVETNLAANSLVGIKFSVIDTGIGIPEAKQNLLFKAFSQVDDSPTRRYHGTGLGLVICKAIIQSMKGTIGFSSTDQKGSNFHFTLTLPMARPEDLANEENSLSQHLKVPKKLKSILLADDVPVNRLVARRLLEKLGLIPDIAENGKEAVDLAAEKNYDLILMDCQMPIMDGYEATRNIRLKERDSIHRSIIIAMTAHAMDEHKQQSKLAGMDDHLSKPLRLKTIRDLLEKHFNVPYSD